MHFLSCKKDAGEGGSATIKGKLLAGNYHSPTASVDSNDAAMEERVYISYGDHNFIDNDMRTNYTGAFEFRFLRPGSYKVFAYSLDITKPSETEIPIIREVQIKDKNEVVELTNFIVYKSAGKAGSSEIRGKVNSKKYGSTSAFLYAPDEDVYIIYGKSAAFSDRTKSAFDGSFQFNKLRKGSYSVYVLSKDSAKLMQGDPNPPLLNVMKSADILFNSQIVTLPDINIFK